MNIVHLSSVHSAQDVRVFHKEAVSLAAAGHEVTVIAKGGFAGTADGVRIHGLTESRTRFQRILGMTRRVLSEALGQHAQVYHLHDPELIPVGLLLKCIGAKVVYDAHEGLREQILSKHWIPGPLRRAVRAMAGVLEWLAGRTFDGIVTATRAIARGYPARKTWVVNNYPLLNESDRSLSAPYLNRPNVVAYAGGITAVRGAREMVRAVGMLSESLNVTLALAGSFDPMALETELRLERGWSRTRQLGWIDRSEVWSLLGKARVGLALFHPEPNHIESQPNKLFEYMSSSLPVVVSDFPLWREVIGTGPCGLLVDPLDPQSIAKAIEWLLQNGTEAEAMGRRGRRLVEERYNWSSEASKLLHMYRWLQQSP